MVAVSKEIQDLYLRVGSRLDRMQKLYLELGGTFSELLHGEDDSLGTPSDYGQLSLLEPFTA